VGDIGYGFPNLRIKRKVKRRFLKGTKDEIEHVFTNVFVMIV
jgi:hypothetical protein